MCARFTVTSRPRDGQQYRVGSSASFLFLAEVPAALVRVTVTQRATQQGYGGDFPPAAGVSFPLSAAGSYDWSITLVTQQYGEICAQSGAFVVIEAATSTPQAAASATASATPAATDGRLCAAFRVTPVFEDGQVFAPDDTLTITLETPHSDLLMRFVVAHRSAGSSQMVEIPGGEAFTLNLPLTLLAEPGLYDWRAALYSETLGEQCAVGGSFVIATPTRTPRPSATPRATP